MPDPTGTYRDGALKFGSQVVTIKDAAGADQTYIMDSFSLEDGARWIVRNNEVGVPAAQLGIKEIPTGSSALQFAADTTKKPRLFAEFTAKEAGDVDVTLIVAKVGQTYGAVDEAKFSIDVRLKLN